MNKRGKAYGDISRDKPWYLYKFSVCSKIEGDNSEPDAVEKPWARV